LPRSTHHAGEVRDGRSVEDLAQRQLDAEHRADAGDDLHGQQRVPAEDEEVVADPDAFPRRPPGTCQAQLQRLHHRRHREGERYVVDCSLSTSSCRCI